MGAGGRIGALLRRHWPARAAVWQSRDALPGAVRLDPLTEPEALARAARGCGAVLCLAGITRGAGMAANVTLARAAVRAAAQAGAGTTGAETGTVRVLLCSSAAVYGRAGGVLEETRAPAPETAYGAAKAEMEAAGAALGAELGVATTSLRIGNVAGADAILGGWREGFTLDRFADGRTPRRSYIGPVTLARVLWELSQAADLPEVLNVAQPGVVEMGALLDAAGLAWTPRPAPESAIAEVALDVARLAGLVAIEPGRAEGMVAEWRC